MSDPWPPDEMRLAMAEAGILKPPPVDPPMPPLRVGDRPTHEGSHRWEYAGDSSTQAYTHVWQCAKVNKKMQECKDTQTRLCTQYTDRMRECRCWEESDGS